MEKLSISQFQDVLMESALKCTEDEIKFLFHVFTLDLKEYRQGDDWVSFEIHYKHTYIINVFIDSKSVCFKHQWIDFKGEPDGVVLTSINTSAQLINAFFNLFSGNLLEGVGFEVLYIDGKTAFSSVKEGQSYLDCVKESVIRLADK